MWGSALPAPCCQLRLLRAPEASPPTGVLGNLPGGVWLQQMLVTSDASGSSTGGGALR